MNTKDYDIRVRGHVGKWYIIDTCIREDKQLFLLEHQAYGDEAPALIVDSDLNIVLDDVYNGFEDLLGIE